MNDMFYGGSIQNIISNNITINLPLWFNEGMAEYQALGWDIDTDMFIRDAAINEYLPDIQQLEWIFCLQGRTICVLLYCPEIWKGKNWGT